MSGRRRLRQSEAAKYLGVSLWWMGEATRRGELPHYVLGNRYEYDPDELDEWLRGQHRPAKEPAAS